MVSENFDELEVHAPAKINLSLKVVGKAKNGYHLLKSYIIFADLKDKIIIKKSTKNVFHVKGVFKNNLLQNGGETLIKKTLVWCQKKGVIKENLNVTLIKNIPVSAGLGGGSADAAALIRACLHLGKKNKALDIIKSSIAIGSDVPACIYSTPLLCEGLGEKITLCKKPYPKKLGIILINPRENLRTKDVFNKLQLKNKAIFKTTKPLELDTIKNIIKVVKIGNDLIDVSTKDVSSIQVILDSLNSILYCKGFGMTGSGATCFGIFSSIQEANQACKIIRSLPFLKNHWFWFGGGYEDYGSHSKFFPVDSI